MYIYVCVCVCVCVCVGGGLYLVDLCFVVVLSLDPVAVVNNVTVIVVVVAVVLVVVVVFACKHIHSALIRNDAAHLKRATNIHVCCPIERRCTDKFQERLLRDTNGKTTSASRCLEASTKVLLTGN